MVKLLCRFYEPDEWSIAVDGVDIRRFDHDEWRERTSAAFQDFGRFELVAQDSVGVGDLPRITDGAAVATALDRAAAADEPTASLDAPTEHALFQRYTDAARRAANANGAVTILVSHRFSTVRMADQIIVLDAGRIIERGSHEELTALGGRYAELYELQARAYR